MATASEDRCIHCIVCCIKKSDGIECDECGCFFCSECLQEVFEIAFKERSWYGFHCCLGPFSFDMVRSKLSKDLQRQFKANEVEIKTKNKTYCHKPQCSTFVKPQSIHNGNGYCQKCRAVTCVKCKSERHDGPCSASEAEKALQELGENEGWRKCPDCARLIERNGGCTDMS